MKNRFFIGAASLLLLSFTSCLEASGQNPTGFFKYDTEKELHQDLTKAGGEYDLYDFEVPELTRAPKGYRPVYISHFGRHGSRYALNDKVYEELAEIFRKGLKEGKLTEMGEDFLARYEKIYPKLAFRGGELTLKGQEQHRKIAQKMYEEFPEVFQGETVAEAIATNSHRVIMSMAAFTNELDRLDPDFSFTMDEGLVYLPALHPNSSHNPYWVRPKSRPASTKELAIRFQESKLDLKSFGARFFNDLEFLDQEYGLYKFMLDIRTFIVDLPSLDFESEDKFEDMITEEELINFWEVWNFNGYVSMGRSPYSDNKNCQFYSPVVRNIFDQADQDLENGKIQLRLRFTHDVALLPILSFLGVNSFGAVIDQPEEVKNYWRCFDVPMASNLQLVFFQNKKISRKHDKGTSLDQPEFLIKFLLNGKEATIPIPEYSQGFYSWDKVKEYYEPILDKADRFIKNY